MPELSTSKVKHNNECYSVHALKYIWTNSLLPTDWRIGRAETVAEAAAGSATWRDERFSTLDLYARTHPPISTTWHNGPMEKAWNGKWPTSQHGWKNAGRGEKSPSCPVAFSHGPVVYPALLFAPLFSSNVFPSLPLPGAYAGRWHGGLAPNGWMIVHSQCQDRPFWVLKIVENLWVIGAPPEPRWESSQRSPRQPTGWRQVIKSPWFFS